MTIGRSGERTVHTIVIDGVTHAVSKEAAPALFTIKKHGLVYFEGDNPITAIRDITEEEYNLLPHCMACAGVMCEKEEYAPGAKPPLCKGCAKPETKPDKKPDKKPETAPPEQPKPIATLAAEDPPKTSQKPTITPPDPFAGFKRCRDCDAPIIWEQIRNPDGKTFRNVKYLVVLDDKGDPKKGPLHECKKEERSGNSERKNLCIVRENVLERATEIVLHGAGDDVTYDSLVDVILPLAERLEKWVLRKEEVTA